MISEKILKTNRKGWCEKDTFEEATSTKNIQRPNTSSHKTEGEVRRIMNQNTKAYENKVNNNTIISDIYK